MEKSTQKTSNVFEIDKLKENDWQRKEIQRMTFWIPKTGVFLPWIWNAENLAGCLKLECTGSAEFKKGLLVPFGAWEVCYGTCHM